MSLDVHWHDTYFVVAHFHFIMVGGTLTAFLAALHYWFPKMTGRMYSERLGLLAAALVFTGFFVTFFPQFILGYLGMPRRYHVYPPEFQVLNVLSSAGASILGVGYLITFIYLVWSLKYGKIAPANPWGATTLEWQTTSPPPYFNFQTIPHVYHAAYEYSLPGEASDYLPQTQPRPVEAGPLDPVMA